MDDNIIKLKNCEGILSDFRIEKKMLIFLIICLIFIRNMFLIL